MIGIKLLWLSDLYDIKSPVVVTLYPAYQLNFLWNEQYKGVLRNSFMFYRQRDRGIRRNGRTHGGVRVLRRNEKRAQREVRGRRSACIRQGYIG